MLFTGEPALAAPAGFPPPYLLETGPVKVTVEDLEAGLFGGKTRFPEKGAGDRTARREPRDSPQGHRRHLRETVRSPERAKAAKLADDALTAQGAPSSSHVGLTSPAKYLEHVDEDLPPFRRSEADARR
jgi:hypothetical protein